MSSQAAKETGLDYLLGLEGNIEFQNDEDYWVSDFYAEVDRILKEVSQ